MVYIDNHCCHHRGETPPPEVKPFPMIPVPAARLNGNAPTQLLPTIGPKAVGKAEVEPRDPEPGEGLRRHRMDDDEDGADMKDVLLGALIGAALAIFVVGVLLILLIG